MAKETSSGWPVALVALGSALWGTDSALRKPLTTAMSSPIIVLYEHLILSLIAIPTVIAARRELRAWKWRHWLAVIGIAWGGSALATVFFTEALSRGNPNTAVLLQKAQPIFTFLLAGPLLGERLRRSHWGYLALAVAGGYLVSFGPTGLGIQRWELTAALFALGASALWGCSTVLGRFLSPQSSFFTITAMRFLVALPALLLIASRQTFVLPSANQSIRLVAMAFIPGLAALLLYYRGLRETPAAVAAIAELCFPLTAVLLNLTFLHQRPAALQLLGFALIWFAVWRIQRTRL